MHYAKVVKYKHFLLIYISSVFNVSINDSLKNNKVLFLFLCSFKKVCVLLFIQYLESCE